MYGHEDNVREQIVAEYRADVELLLRYLPWLSKKSGKDVSTMYTGDAEKPLIPIPVYDSTLLAFVKDCEKTKLIDRNYPYVYSRNNIKTHEDEIRLMESAKITDLKFIKGCLSKYVLGGRTKASLWAEGVDAGIFETALSCLNKLFFTNTKDGSKMIRY